MSVTAAARKVNISKQSGIYYYNVYRNNPERKIPSPRNRHMCISRVYTQEQIENLIRYIEDDKMALKETSAKANLTYSSGHHYYNRYLKDPNHNIPVSQSQYIYTQDQKNKFLGYIINDKMSIKAASKKARMNVGTAENYYKHFKVQNPDIPTPGHIATLKCYTQEQIKEVIGYIVDDKMTIKAASRKANFNEGSARKYYRQYLNDNNMEIPAGKKNLHTSQYK